MTLEDRLKQAMSAAGQIAAWAPELPAPGERIARRWFADYSGEIPAGAFPAGWVPPRAA